MKYILTLDDLMELVKDGVLTTEGFWKLVKKAKLKKGNLDDIFPEKELSTNDSEPLTVKV